MFGALPQELRPLPRAPSLPDMMISGTPAADLLSQTFTSEQLPHLVYPTRIQPLTRSGLLLEQQGGDAPADDWQNGDEAWGVRVDLTAVSPSQDESDSALASVVEGGDHSGCTTPQAAIPPHRRMQQQEDGSLEVWCNARVWLLEAQLEAKEQELQRMKQALRDARGDN